jgi:hypothetical protein
VKGDSTESGGQSSNPFFDEEDDIGTIHLRRQHFLGGEGSKNCQICRLIKVRKSRKYFLKPTFPPKNGRTNSTLLL